MPAPQTEVTPSVGDVLTMRYMHKREDGEPLAFTNPLNGMEFSWVTRVGVVIAVFPKLIVPKLADVELYYGLTTDDKKYKYRHMYKGTRIDRVVTEMERSRQNYHVWPWVKSHHFKCLGVTKKP